MNSSDSIESSLGRCWPESGGLVVFVPGVFDRYGSGLGDCVNDAKLERLVPRDILFATITLSRSSAKLAILGCAKLAARLAVLLAWQRDLLQLLPGFSCTSSTSAGGAFLACLLMGGAAGLINIRLASCIVSVVARWCSSSWAVRESREVVVGLDVGDRGLSGVDKRLGDTKV